MLVRVLYSDSLSFCTAAHFLSARSRSSSPLPACRSLPRCSFAMEFEPLNLHKLQTFIERGKVDASQPIDMRVLLEAGVIGKPVDGVKLLGDVSSSQQSAASALHGPPAWGKTNERGAARGGAQAAGTAPPQRC